MLTWIAIQSTCILEVSSDNSFQITALLKNKIENKSKRKTKSKTKAKQKQKVQKIMKLKGWPSRIYNT
jgi:hypothetical protein